MVHPVLLEGVGPQACVLCSWCGYTQRMQVGFCIWTVQVVLVHRNNNRAALSLGKICVEVITAWKRGYLPGKPARQP